MASETSANRAVVTAGSRNCCSNSTTLAESNANILDIAQTILVLVFFTMTMLVELQDAESS